MTAKVCYGWKDQDRWRSYSMAGLLGEIQCNLNALQGQTAFLWKKVEQKGISPDKLMVSLRKKCAEAEDICTKIEAKLEEMGAFL